MADEKVPSPSLADEKSTSLDELLTEEERKALEEKYDEIVAVKTKAGVAVFRKFTRGEYARYNKLLFDEKSRPQAFEALVTTCVVKPDAKTYLSWLDRYPGITETCLKQVLELGGVEQDAHTKKYGTA